MDARSGGALDPTDEGIGILGGPDTATWYPPANAEVLFVARSLAAVFWNYHDKVLDEPYLLVDYRVLKKSSSDGEERPFHQGAVRINPDAEIPSSLKANLPTVIPPDLLELTLQPLDESTDELIAELSSEYKPRKP